MVTKKVFNTIQDAIADVKQVVYATAKGGMGTPIFHSEEEYLIYTVQRGCFGKLLVRNKDVLSESDISWIHKRR